MNGIAHVVSVSGGKDSQAAWICATETVGSTVPKGEIIPVFCDTGNEHELVYDHLDYLERRMGVAITRIKRDFTEELRRHRDRLLAIAAGAPDYYPAAKTPWTKETARRAASVVWPPTGNPFLDLCLLRGVFPSRTRQFCTEELKRDPMVEFELGIAESGATVWAWQGVRADESSRRGALLCPAGIPSCDRSFEEVGARIFNYRPILRWTIEDVLSASLDRGIDLNPLYRLGMMRVGCMLCVNASKLEIREAARRFPSHIGRLEEWEELVSSASRSRAASFFVSNGDQNRASIPAIVKWSKTTRGGKQYDLLAPDGDMAGCSSAYGLCETEQ